MSRLITNRTANIPGPKASPADGYAIRRRGATMKGEANETELEFLKTVLEPRMWAGEIGILGKDVITLRYTPPFPAMAGEPAVPSRTYTADFVTEESGVLCFYEVKGSGPIPRETRPILELCAVRFLGFRFFLAVKRPRADGGGFRIERIGR